MVQQTQPNVGQTQSVTQQPVVQTTQSVEGQTQPVEGQGEISVWKKWWTWLIIALVVIGACVGAYFLFLR